MRTIEVEGCCRHIQGRFGIMWAQKIKATLYETMDHARPRKWKVGTSVNMGPFERQYHEWRGNIRRTP